MSWRPKTAPSRSGRSPQLRGAAEAVLLGSIRIGVVLLLLTPMIVTMQTVFPWVVGKAVFARGVIEVLFALWAVLALLNPAYRLPRSWLLALLAIGFIWSVVAALFGVSLVRSVWSNYERMQGLFDAVHWIACFVVFLAVFRTMRHLLVVVNIHLGVGAVVALLAIASFFELPVLIDAQPKINVTRIGGLLGNALFLGGYAAVNSVLAIGLCVHSWLTSRRGARRAVAVLCYGGAALLNIHALALTEAMSAWLSLVAAAAFAVLAFAFWGRSRRLRILVAATAIAGLVGGGAVLAVPQTGSTVFERLIALGTDESGQQRSVALFAGVAAFMERPLAGFGPENFIVAWGRHASTGGKEAHDSAHNRVLEEAATKGILGLGAYAALWVFAYLVLARRARAATPDEGALLLAVGAALTCFFVNDQLRFPTTVLNLQQLLLFALVAHWERTRREASVVTRLQALCGRAGTRAGVAVAAVAAAVAGLYLNVAVYAAASDIAKVGRPGQPGAYLERAIERFEPLANTPRVILIEQLAQNWRVIRVRESAEALRLLAFVEEQAALAIAAEPANWQIHHALARLHSEVARGDPAHREKAAYHLAKSQELAPGVPPRLVRGW